MFMIRTLLSSILLACSIMSFGQQHFTLSVQSRYDEMLKDSLYNIQIVTNTIPENSYLMTIELYDTHQNKLMDKYYYYLLNTDLSTAHNHFEKDDDQWIFFLGGFPRQMLDLEKRLKITDLNGSELYTDTVQF